MLCVLLASNILLVTASAFPRAESASELVPLPDTVLFSIVPIPACFVVTLIPACAEDVIVFSANVSTLPQETFTAARPFVLLILFPDTFVTFAP